MKYKLKKNVFYIVLLGFLLLLSACGDNSTYRKAASALDSQKYEQAIQEFESIKNYEDSAKKIQEANYLLAEQLFQNGQYESAYEHYKEALDEYKDVAQIRMESIDCMNAVMLDLDNEINAAYNYNNNAITESYYGFFGLNFHCSTEYDIQNYTYYFRIYLSDVFDTLYDFGAMLGADTSFDHTETASDIYERFYNRGFENITVIVEINKSNGSFLDSTTYSKDNYLTSRNQISNEPDVTNTLNEQDYSNNVNESDYSDNNSAYILPGSNSRYIEESELYGFGADECRLARNEIYAWHGRKFNSADLQDYFNAQSWYVPTIEADEFSDSMFNEYEKANINLILEYEKAQGYR